MLVHLVLVEVEVEELLQQVVHLQLLQEEQGEQELQILFQTHQ
jgi:hypothetical protein